MRYSGLSTGERIYSQMSLPVGLCWRYETLLYVAEHRAVLFMVLKQPWFAYTLAGGGGAQRSLGVATKGHRQVTKHQP